MEKIVAKVEHHSITTRIIIHVAGLIISGIVFIIFMFPVAEHGDLSLFMKLCFIPLQVLIIFIRLLCNLEVKSTSLCVTADKIKASYGKLFRKEMLIPIAKPSALLLLYSHINKTGDVDGR